MTAEKSERKNGAVARSDFSLWRQSYFLLQSLLEMFFKIYTLKKGTQKNLSLH